MLKFDLNLLWTVINLIVFFILMKVFLFKPIKKTLDKRKALIDQQFSDAQADADKIKAEAKKASDFECEKARSAVNEQIAALAMETAEKVIGKNVSAETDSELYNKFLNESSDEK